LEFTKSEFESVYKTTKTRKEHKAHKDALQALVTKSEAVIAKMPVFNFGKFQKEVFKTTTKDNEITLLFDLTIEKLKKNYQYGSASSYELCLKSLVKFVGREIDSEGLLSDEKLKIEHEKLFSKIRFIDINPEWLQDYETYMLEDLQRSRTTVGIYLRALRAIFNNAIQQGEIDDTIYPFGKNKYQIPSAKNIKKALDASELKILLNAEAKTPEQQKARDFWFFSFACNGMNLKDIALLKYKDLHGDTLQFYRAKTINTAKHNLKPVSIYLTDFALSIIEKYGNKEKNTNQFIFPIFSDNQTKEEQHWAIKNFTRFVNQNLKKLASDNGITESISSYFARHSWATNAIRKGASMEFVSEGLDHKNIKTTQGYIAGFPEETKREFAKKSMEF